MHESDRIPQQLHALIRKLEIKKTADNGKETVVRLIPPGELFVAPAIFGNGISPATVICKVESQVLTIDREALLQVISQSPEISLRILEVFNQRLQQLHNTVHRLISERAMVRLIRLIQYYGDAFFRTVILQVVRSGGSFGENDDLVDFVSAHAPTLARYQLILATKARGKL